MSKKTIFYSWQSDLDQKKNNYFIKDCIERALKKINRNTEFQISLDKDTVGATGSPDIVDTILKKITLSDIFICDVTIINNSWLSRLLKSRKTPNPNVLVELGYAVKTLGWERIICVVNTDQCKIEDLPFDIRKNRTTTFVHKKHTEKNKAREVLTNTMTDAIGSIIDDYDEIVKRFLKDDNLNHDVDLFRKFDDRASQKALFESMEFLATSMRTNNYYYKLWDFVQRFTENYENGFLNEEIQNTIVEFASSLGKVKSLAAQNLFPEKIPGQKYASDYRDAGLEITEDIQFEIDQDQRFRYPESPRDDDWNAFNERRYATQDKFTISVDAAMQAYKEFRMSVKKALHI